MVKFYESAFEMMDYTSRLPGANLHEIRETVMEIWENRTCDILREEWGAFQVFDKNGNIFFNNDIGRELELTLNEQLENEGYPIKLSIRQIVVSSPLFRIPTFTYEIVVLDNTRSESVDPIIDWMIENRQELN